MNRLISPSSGNLQDSIIIMQPNDLDIICGGGKLAFAHIGNKRFQVIARKYLQAFERAGNKVEKMKVTQKAMLEVLSLGCTRFLKKDPIYQRFYVASKRAGRDKILHFLRSQSARHSLSWNACEQQSLRRRANCFPQVNSVFSSKAVHVLGKKNAKDLMVDMGGYAIASITALADITPPSMEVLEHKNSTIDSFTTAFQPRLCCAAKESSFDNGFSLLQPSCLHKTQDIAQISKPLIQDIFGGVEMENSHLSLLKRNSVLADESAYDVSETTPELALTFQHNAVFHDTSSQYVSSHHQLKGQQPQARTPLERMCYDLGLFLQDPAQP